MIITIVLMIFYIYVYYVIDNECDTVNVVRIFYSFFFLLQD